MPGGPESVPEKKKRNGLKDMGISLHNLIMLGLNVIQHRCVDQQYAYGMDLVGSGGDVAGSWRQQMYLQ